MYIYKTTNNINGKIYIGLSEKCPNDTLTYLGSGDAIKKAISKYGGKNFHKEILIDAISDRIELARLEIFYIKRYKSTDRKIGYNISPGGDLNPDHIKKEIYQYSIDGIFIEKYNNINDAKKAIDSKNSDLYKIKIRDSHPIKGFWWSTVQLESADIIIKNDEYIKRKNEILSNGAKKRYLNVEYLLIQQEHMREIRKNVKNLGKSEEQRKNISDSIKGRKWYNDPLSGKSVQSYECPDGYVQGRK